MGKQLQSNIWKYALMSIANKRVFVAILGAYYLTIPDVTPQIIGLILLAGNAAGFFLEIPSGFVADKIGHARTLVMARVLMLCSTGFFLFSNSISLLVLGSVFLSASTAFHSGTGSAFIHETLRGLKRTHEYTKVMGKISAIGFAVPVIFATLAPFLITMSYKAPFVLGFIVDMVGLLAALSLARPPVPEEHVEEIRATNFKAVMREGYALSYFSVALFSGILGGILMGIGGFREAYYVFLGIPVIWYGIFFGIGRVFVSLMLAYSGAIKKKFSLTSFYRFQLILFTLLLLIVGVTDTWWVIIAVFITINAFQWGLLQVDEGFRLDIIKSSTFKATLLSVSAQINQAVAAVSGLALGFLSERLSYQYGFLYLGIIFLAVLFPLYLYIAHRYKKGAYGAL
ncbi:MAG: hypothetical protein A3D67_02275 [Candidatus Lloydbacteria bacterium RIFCSPHIGHO2_02_FULL_51_22]|uniref:Major facilitator superfamily (MFS) profile domain-containing protein n=3 Tax=Candidatus Lloydiibacteriota TaxID=1817910 RepID=A0A1G2DAM5_9BACT|nr:MAG: hypothetical protein A3D67_02275 [Candidatus Lloydbacteria bacterium RIFCSPHIGHO2_02_FULL_51_22]OGZ14051.1 MAG: hypothetical protein A3J08_03955 [Candidatus Lloydbacteria bacterium RIFCSPLOWO2_02_FULL_51_11]OGZ17283.1 MAG: hypothetical protein A3G11_01780 [Candidatus Lloydbacteria bacterium RIFCSPLOWO2_12_FULL_51_9]